MPFDDLVKKMGYTPKAMDEFMTRTFGDPTEQINPLEVTGNLMEEADSVTGKPVRAAALAAIEGRNPLSEAKEYFGAGPDKEVSGQDVAHSFLKRTEESSGIPLKAPGMEQYPSEVPAGLAVDFASQIPAFEAAKSASMFGKAAMKVAPSIVGNEIGAVGKSVKRAPRAKKVAPQEIDEAALKKLQSKYSDYSDTELDTKVDELSRILNSNNAAIGQDLSVDGQNVYYDFMEMPRSEAEKMLREAKAVLDSRPKTPKESIWEPRKQELPMDEASRLTRAKEMGFDTDKTWYHGTNTPGFESFDITRPPKGADESVPSRGAVFLTQDPKIASNFASVRDKPGAVLPLNVATKNTFDYQNPEHLKKAINALTPEKQLELLNNISKSAGLVSEKTPQETLLRALSEGRWYDIEDPVFTKALKDAGFDSFLVSEYGKKNLGVFDSTKIRSKFAKFDPSKTDSGDLAAGLAGAALLGAGASEEQSDENKYDSLRKLVSPKN
jgi:hypothetical protein